MRPKPFKFFKGTQHTIDTLDGVTYATGSVNNDFEEMFRAHQMRVRNERNRLEHRNRMNEYEQQIQMRRLEIQRELEIRHRNYMLNQPQNDREERQRQQIRADIASRFEVTNSDIERRRLEIQGRLDAVSTLTDELLNNLNKPSLWSRIKASSLYRSQKEIYFTGFICFMLAIIGLSGFVILMLKHKI